MRAFKGKVARSRKGGGPIQKGQDFSDLPQLAHGKVSPRVWEPESGPGSAWILYPWGPALSQGISRWTGLTQQMSEHKS